MSEGMQEAALTVVEEFFDAADEADPGEEANLQDANSTEEAMLAMDADSLTLHVDEKRVYTEPEAQDVLVNWQQRRDAVNKVRKARGFAPLQVPKPDVRKLLSRTKCFGCGQLGHLRRNCPKGGRGKSGKGGKAKTSLFAVPVIFMGLFPICAEVVSTTKICASYVANEVCSVLERPSVKVKYRSRRLVYNPVTHEAAYFLDLSGRQRKLLSKFRSLWSDPTSIPDIEVYFNGAESVAIADTGCARCVGGSEALDALVKRFREAGYTVLEEDSDVRFRFGNGTIDAALCKLTFPVLVGGWSALITIHKVPGSGPILISNGVLRALSHGIPYDRNCLEMRIGEDHPLIPAPSGHLLIELKPPPVETWNIDTECLIEHTEVQVYATCSLDSEPGNDVWAQFLSEEVNATDSLELEDQEFEYVDCLSGQEEVQNTLDCETEEEDNDVPPLTEAESEDDVPRRSTQQPEESDEETESETDDEEDFRWDDWNDNSEEKVCETEDFHWEDWTDLAKDIDQSDGIAKYGSFNVDLGDESEWRNFRRTIAEERGAINKKADEISVVKDQDWDLLKEGTVPVLKIAHNESRRCLISHDQVPPEWWGDIRDKVCGRVTVVRYEETGMEDVFMDSGETNDDLERDWKGFAMFFRKEHAQAPADPSRAFTVLEGASVRALPSRVRKSLIQQIDHYLLPHTDPTAGREAGPTRLETIARHRGLDPKLVRDASLQWQNNESEALRWIHNQHPSCTAASVPNEVRAATRLRAPLAWRDASVKWGKFIYVAGKQQISGERYFVFEVPNDRFLESHESVKKLLDLPGVRKVVTEGCAHGMTSPKNGLPMRRRLCFVTNSPQVAGELDKECDGAHTHGGGLSCEEGRERLRWPSMLTDHVLRGIEQEALSRFRSDLQEVEVHANASSEKVPRATIDQQLRKLHRNLGHPSSPVFLRIMRHGGAAPEVLKAASELRCDICDGRKEPGAPRTARASEHPSPLESLHMDCKQYVGWEKGLKIYCLNIICEGSHLHRVIPVSDHENSAELRKVYRAGWKRWYGAPSFLWVDAARWNTGPAMRAGCEVDGTHSGQAPGEAHNQMGLVEAHGRLFEKILGRVIDEHSPQTREAWEECLDIAMDVKNQMLRVGGSSPEQIVFGRDRRIPEDLLTPESQENPQVNSLILNPADPAARAARIRRTARKAFVEELDSCALREAMNARPRIYRQFKQGERVCFWRKQRATEKRGRWNGPAIICGREGQNYLLSYAGQLIKCSPEQLRSATEEESIGERAISLELKEISARLRNSRGVQRGFLDISGEDGPPLFEEPVGQERQSRQARQAEPASQEEPAASPPAPDGVPQERLIVLPNPSAPPSQEVPAPDQDALPDLELQDAPGTPVLKRQIEHQPLRRLRMKTPFGAALRNQPPAPPPAGQGGSSGSSDTILDEIGTVGLEDECTFEVLQAADLLPWEDCEFYEISPDPLRSEDWFEIEDPLDPTPEAAQRYFRQEWEEDSNVVVEVYAVGGSSCSTAPAWTLEGPIWGLTADALDEQSYLEDLQGTYFALQPKKEKPGRDLSEKQMTPEQLSRFGVAKDQEWDTVIKSGAIRLRSLEDSLHIRKTMQHRIMKCRMLLDEKVEETGARAKARLILLGHLDPDLLRLVKDGETVSSTVAVDSLNLALQLIASLGADIELGDIKGAFTLSDEMNRPEGPLFCDMPPGFLPEGVDSRQVFEVVRHLYGLNSAPPAWQAKCTSKLLELGFYMSSHDQNLFYWYGRRTTGPKRGKRKLEGVLVMHVDDVACGGISTTFRAAVTALRAAFPFRKWRVGSGDYVGRQITQDPVSKIITVDQSEFAVKLKPVKVRNGVKPTDPATPQELSAGRGLCGSGSWLSGGARPDLAVLVSTGMQRLASGTVADIREVNHIARRDRQMHDSVVRVLPIPLDSLELVMRSDASLGNAAGLKTQAGYVIACTDSRLNQGTEAPYSPLFWKSFKLRRAVGSTLGAEGQALREGLGHMMYFKRMLAEATDPDTPFTEVFQETTSTAVTDAKSVYDCLKSPSPPSHLNDKFCALDMIIIREAARRANVKLRWGPSALQPADGLTKQTPEAGDTLRGVLREGKYTLASEEEALARRAREKERRAQLGQERARQASSTITNNSSSPKS